MARGKTIFETGATAGEMKAKNPDNFNPNLGRIRYHIESEIYIFSCARKTFQVSQTLFPSIELKGCTSGERYVLAATIADPVPQASPDLERGGARIDYEDGWRAAIGLLNPENYTNDPFSNAEGASMSPGTNLIAQGLWPAKTNPPKEEDIRRAEILRDKRYRRLCDEAMRAAATSSKRLSDFLREHEDVHDAMDALGLQADWHRKRVVTAQCPNCGDEISPHLAFHRSSAGVLCVIDPQRAFKAGAIDKERYEELATAPTA